MFALKFGFPILTSNGRLHCFGVAQLLIPSLDSAGDHFSRIVNVTLTPHIAQAALKMSGYEEAIAAAEAELREKDFGEGVEFRSISELTLGDVFRKTPPPGPPVGAAVLARWQGQTYPATVLEITGDQYMVQWDGSESWAWIPLTDLQPRS